MATTAGLMTVEEYRALPDDPGKRVELHDGELFEISHPKLRHWKVQDRLTDLLKPLLRTKGTVGSEFGFRPTPEYNLCVADVAFVSKERFESADPNDNLYGAPELVIEVESPSNTAAEFERRERMCLANGCREFWIVYPKLQGIRVSTFDGRVRRYGQGDTIELTIAPGAAIAVDEIFA